MSTRNIKTSNSYCNNNSRNSFYNITTTNSNTTDTSTSITKSSLSKGLLKTAVYKMIHITSGLSELSLAIADFDWNNVETIITTKPCQSLQWVIRYGLFEGVRDAHCLPLHEVCIISTTPTYIIKLILHANVTAAKTRETAYRRLPLHCICRRRHIPTNSTTTYNLQSTTTIDKKAYLSSSLDDGNCISDCTTTNSNNTTNPSNTNTMEDYINIVKEIIVAYPAGCLVPDDLGRLPLHYALSNGAPAALIHMLINTNPKSCNGVDNRGWTPLHVACSIATTSYSVIQSLLHYCPEAIVLHTKKGSIPIQLLPSISSSSNTNTSTGPTSSTASTTTSINKLIQERIKIKQLLKDSRIAFDLNFRTPFNTNRKTLLHDNHDVVLV